MTKTARRGINSIETGNRVLESLVKLRKPSPLKMIAQTSGMDASQAHRYLASLINTGLIRQDATTGLYSLGPRALQIGLAALSRLDPIDEITSTAKRVSRENGYTMLLSIWTANGPAIMHWFAGRPPVHTNLAVGDVLPMTTTATGQIFMSFLDANYIDPRLEAEGWKVPLERNKKLRDICARVRANYLAGVDDVFVPGLRAYAAPVFGIHNHMIAVLTAVCSKAIPESGDSDMIEVLLDTCANLSISLGGNWKVESVDDFGESRN